MSKVKGINTKPELKVRRLLFNAGFRYRISPRHMPGKPDLYLPKYKAVIFVNGCFWHVHNCYMFVWPKTNINFWKKKLQSNVKRDEQVIEKLKGNKLRVLTVWECAIKGRRKLPDSILLQLITRWLLEGYIEGNISSEGLSLTNK